MVAGRPRHLRVRLADHVPRVRVPARRPASPPTTLRRNRLAAAHATAFARPLADYSAYTDAMGLKTVAWAPSTQFVAAGSYDQAVRLLNTATWRAVATLDHASRLEDERLVVYREVEAREPGGTAVLAGGAQQASVSKYAIETTPLVLESVRRP